MIFYWIKIRTTKEHVFFNFTSSNIISRHFIILLVHKFESLISDLKMNCKDKTINSIQECEKIKVELEKNCDFLNGRLKQTREELNFHISEINEIKNDIDKIKRLNERIKCESTYINTEIPLIKEIIIKV